MLLSLLMSLCDLLAPFLHTNWHPFPAVPGAWHGAARVLCTLVCLLCDLYAVVLLGHLVDIVLHIASSAADMPSCTPMCVLSCRPFSHAGFWAVQNFVRPLRISLALALAPAFDKAITQLGEKLNIPKGW